MNAIRVNFLFIWTFQVTFRKQSEYISTKVLHTESKLHVWVFIVFAATLTSFCAIKLINPETLCLFGCDLFKSHESFKFNWSLPNSRKTQKPQNAEVKVLLLCVQISEIAIPFELNCFSIGFPCFYIIHRSGSRSKQKVHVLRNPNVPCSLSLSKIETPSMFRI